MNQNELKRSAEAKLRKAVGPILDEFEREARLKWPDTITLHIAHGSQTGRSMEDNYAYVEKVEAPITI